MTQTLYQLVDEAQALDLAFEASGGETTPETEAALAQLTTDLAAKVDGVGYYLWDLQARITQVKAEAQRVAEHFRTRRRVLENTHARLLAYLLEQMDRLGTTKLAGDIHALAVQAHGGKPPLILRVEDPAAYPREVCDVTVTLNKERIRDALEAGTLPAGLAELGERGRGVRLR